MRTINRKKLKDLIKNQGEGGLAKTSLGALISISTLEKMLAGTYKSSPKESLRLRLCRYLNATESDLFPPKQKKTA